MAGSASTCPAILPNQTPSLLPGEAREIVRTLTGDTAKTTGEAGGTSSRLSILPVRPAHPIRPPAGHLRCGVPKPGSPPLVFPDVRPRWIDGYHRHIAPALDRKDERSMPPLRHGPIGDVKQREVRSSCHRKAGGSEAAWVDRSAPAADEQVVQGLPPIPRCVNLTLPA